MPDNTVPPTANGKLWKQVLAYLLDREHLRNILFVLAGGYAVGLFLWETGHKAQLAEFISTNQVPSGQGPSLLLLAGIIVLFVLAWLSLSALVSALSGRRVATVLDLGSALILAASLLAFLPLLSLKDIETEHPILTFAAIAAMAVIAGVASQEVVRHARGTSLVDWLRRPIAGRLALALVVVFTIGYIVYMSVLTIARHNLFLTHSFDLGIHDQALYTLLRLGYMRSTQYGAEPINYIGDHFSPIFYLVAPIYAIYQHAETLLILQSVALGIGAIPVFLLARRKIGSISLAVALSAAYLLYPALHGVNTFDFHQIALVTPLLLFSLYFLETGRDKLFLAALVLALLVKEEVALSVAAIGLYVALVKGRGRLGYAIAAVGLAYFLAVTQVVMPALGGVPQINRFAGMMAPGSEGLAAVAKTLLTNPFYTAVFVFSNQDRLVYLVQLLLPVLFLPLLAGGAWIAALPAISVALLTSAETQFSISYQYSAIIIPFIFFLAVLGVRALSPSRFSLLRTALAASVLVAGLAMNYSYGWIFSKQSPEIPEQTQHAADVAACLRDVPQSVSVSTTSDLLPHVSGRKDIYLFPIVNGADYIVFDADPTANFWPFVEWNARNQAIGRLVPLVVSGEYGLVTSRGGCLVLKRGHDTAANREALRALLTARYEAESLRSDFATLDLPDPQASERTARVARPDLPRAEGKNALTYGPYATLFPGRYRVDFALHLDGSGVQGRVATVDVFSNTAGGALAARDVFAADLAGPDRYQRFPVEVDVKDLLPDLEYRILYGGQGDLWADFIEVTPIEVALPAADYEAERLPSDYPASAAGGDEQASGGQARVATPSMEHPAGKNALIYGPYARLIPGHYRARFSLKVEDPVQGVNRSDVAYLVATLQVLANGRTLASRDIAAMDFQAARSYQLFDVEFAADEPLTDVEYRVLYGSTAGGQGSYPSADNETLWVDRVSVFYLYGPGN
jgi:uncharacterized membrane protein